MNLKLLTFLAALHVDLTVFGSCTTSAENVPTISSYYSAVRHTIVTCAKFFISFLKTFLHLCCEF